MPPLRLADREVVGRNHALIHHPEDGPLRHLQSSRPVIDGDEVRACRDASTRPHHVSLREGRVGHFCQLSFHFEVTANCSTWRVDAPCLLPLNAASFHKRKHYMARCEQVTSVRPEIHSTTEMSKRAAGF